MIVAVIPARGGSKRIPRKNIRLFAGRPIIAYSIEAALASELFDRVIVSTDDAEIAEVARAWGAETPFVRAPELSDDYAGTGEVTADAVRRLAELGMAATYVCCIYATAPFVTPASLKQGYELVTRPDASFALTVTTFGFPIQRAIELLPGIGVAPMYPEHTDARSQDLAPAYHDAGQFYWGRADAWTAGEPAYGPHTYPLLLPRHLVQDIDTLEDWQRAEWMYRSLVAAGELSAPRHASRQIADASCR
jgi:N-acylneuraminate cytidylyltransferase